MTLCNFVGCNPESENPVVIKKLYGYGINNYIKLSDNFSSFSSSEQMFEDMCYYTLFTLINVGIIALIICSINIIKDYIGMYLGIILGIFLFMLLLYLDYKIINNRMNVIKRIDIIYSSDFDRIFIGLVKFYEKSYRNTFIYDINTVEKFILQRYKNTEKIYTLKVQLKDQDIQDLFLLNKDYFNTNDFLKALNEKLDKKESKENTINLY